MSITIPKKQTKLGTDKKEERFISGAPDASHNHGGVKKGNKRQITLTLSPNLLERVDEAAHRYGQTRASVINMAIYQALEKGFSFN